MTRTLVTAAVLLLNCVPGISSAQATAGTATSTSARPATAPPVPLRKITVDASAQVGTLRSLAGVNGAPAPGMHKPENFTFGGWNMPEKVDASAGYRMAAIDLVRTHDGYGPGDIDATFETDVAPGGALISAKRDVFSIFKDPNADPENPASYHFGPTDAQVGSIRKLGAQVIFRLGRSEGANPRPPKDFARYANIAKHIVLHYNRGWANGFHYGIRYWEVWNEPDLGKVFWSGTAAQYFDLYARIAHAVKQADPQAWVGGPAIARPNDDSPYRDAFMDYVRGNKVPLDFYSWHWYATDSEDPMDFVRISRDLRARLDKHGLTHTRSFLTEWNYGLDDPPPPLLRATFIASAISYMQDAPIDAATLYRADNVFGADGATPDPTGRVLIALGRMKSTPVRLKVEGTDQNGLSVTAARSTDARTVHVLFTNYEIPPARRGPRGNDNTLHVPNVFDVRLLGRRSVTYSDNGGVDLTIDHLPAGRYRVERCLVAGTARSASDWISTVQTGPRIRLQARLPPPGVELITVQLEGRSPSLPAAAARCIAAPTQSSKTADRLD